MTMPQDSAFGMNAPKDPRQGEFLRLLMACQIRIYTFIIMMVPNTSDADDIMQETAITMWNKFDQYKTGTDFTAWGVAIARFKIMNLMKKTRKSPIHFSSETVEMIEKYIPRSSSGQSSVKEIISYCLSKLPEKDRHLIVMRYNQGLTIKALAEQMGRSVHGLYSTMARIHNLLVECVRGKQLGEGVVS